MTTKVIVYRRSDGIVEIVNPAPKFMAELINSGLSETEALQVVSDNANDHMTDRGFGPMEDVEIFERELITQIGSPGRVFRDALEKPGLGLPAVNMAKARVIQTQLIQSAKERKARNLIEQEMLGKNITADKAILRAINKTAQIAAAQTPADLENLWPSEFTLPESAS